MTFALFYLLKHPKEEAIDLPASFIIRFFICNIIITILTMVILSVKLVLKNHLSGRMQYNLWFLLLAFLTTPFLPIPSIGVLKLFSQLGNRKNNTFFKTVLMGQTNLSNRYGETISWMNDFSISADRETSSVFPFLFFTIWGIGMFIMLVLLIKSQLHLYHLKKSSLPLQNQEIQRLFNICRQEMNIKKDIPVYSTAFLKSPVTTGIVNPRIYIPIYLVSDFNATDMRYMLLHELQHYRHRDALTNYLVNLSNVVYWFHPFVWYALKEMRNDREIACDSSVLQMLTEDDYEKYGNTLINFAEKTSLHLFPFTNGISGNMKQMKKRILNIAAYRPETKWTKIKEGLLFVLLAVFVMATTALLPVQAAQEAAYFSKPEKNLTVEDLSSYFQGYDGCFVLYNLETDSWQIYNETASRKRVSPDSTFKIYSALLGLENQYITQDDTLLKWDGAEYPFSEWNKDQSLASAFTNSVNWYFQRLDHSAGLDALEKFYTGIEYGNHDLSGGVSEYWRESSLKISALEQVELLKKLYTNEFGFEKQNVETVKEALRLSSSTHGILYGKTGTGNINNQYINGWFVGYVKSSTSVYIFATNIQNDSSASGSTASKITLDILQSKNIY